MSFILLVMSHVTIPPWSPLTVRARQQESYEPEQDSWQISCLVSADTFDAGHESHDTGDVRTGKNEDHVIYDHVTTSGLWIVSRLIR